MRRIERASFADRVNLAGRTVIVTGAGPGSIGCATAQALAEWGARVVVTTRAGADATVRDIAGDVIGRPMDLTDPSSVVDFVDWYAAREGGLDILVNNAGIHLDLRSKWQQPHLTDDGFEIHWRTNYLGTMHLTHLLLPLLKRTGERTGDARVVNVVSKLHVLGRNEFLFAPLEPYHSWDAYGLSKLALVHASNEIAARYAGSNVRAYAVHPGSVYSNIADRGLEGHRVIGVARKLLAPIESRVLLSPEQGAQTTLHCATAPDLPSGYYRACAPAEASPEVADRTVAARLWTDTSKWVAGLP
jgi:NAD(P)-dependent dehydrogenase (short-subunit alcohol dehydrogenase family)